MANGELLLSIMGMVKDFFGNRAFDDVSFDVYSGEIVVVVGYNGLGKSTFVKIFAGVYTKDEGEVLFFVFFDEVLIEFYIIY